MSNLADQTCLRCRKQKRKCDKILPFCTLCKRLNKPCCYSLPVETPRLVPVPDLADLTPSNLRHTLEAQVSSIVGDGPQLQAAAAAYFRTVHTWFPVVSETAYHIRLSELRVQTAPSDFSLLTLCMALVCKEPVGGEIPLPMRSLYTQLKSFVAILEAMGPNSLEMLQCRLLLTIFEIGHAMYPSAYISAGANVRAAVALGASAASTEDLCKVFRDPQKAEEARQIWRGIVITDRYASLESGQAPSAPRGRSIEAVGTNGHTKDLAQVDAFTKLAHASQLLDQVLAHVHVHVHATTSHPLFNGVQAIQIVKSLTSFLEILQSDGSNPHPLSDSSLALCRSAMLEILETGSHMGIRENNKQCVHTSVNILKSLVHEVGRGPSESSPLSIELAALPVFLPHCLYKAAVLSLSDARVSGGVDPEPSIRPLKDLLGYLGMRWMAAKYYLENIERAYETIGL